MEKVDSCDNGDDGIDDNGNVGERDDDVGWNGTEIDWGLFVALKE